MKYVCVKMGKGKNAVISRIAVETSIKGFTIGVLEPFFPSDEIIETMSDEEVDKYVLKNNKLMTAVCEFLNSREDL